MKAIKKIYGNLRNVSPGTWARLFLLIAALVNNTLAVFGIGPVSPEGRAGEIITAALTVLVSLFAYWKNNSFSSAAVTADEFLKYLRESGEK